MGDALDGHWVTLSDGRHILIPDGDSAGHQGHYDEAHTLTPAERGAMANRVTPEVRLIAAKSQEEVAKLVGGRVIPDNGAHDVVVGRNVIEVKTLVDAKNDRLPLQREQRIFKNAMDTDKRAWTIGVDKRVPGKVFYFLFPGHGAFRIWNKVNPTPPEVIRDLFLHIKRGGRI